MQFHAALQTLACSFLQPAHTYSMLPLLLLVCYAQVVYISCNPETLAKNLRSVAHSHDIVRMAVFDQFPYTEHIEAGVVIKRKPDATAV
jgi:hypothetical protein